MIIFRRTTCEVKKKRPVEFHLYSQEKHLRGFYGTSIARERADLLPSHATHRALPKAIRQK